MCARASSLPRLVLVEASQTCSEFPRRLGTNLRAARLRYGSEASPREFIEITGVKTSSNPRYRVNALILSPPINAPFEKVCYWNLKLITID